MRLGRLHELSTPVGIVLLTVGDAALPLPVHVDTGMAAPTPE